MKKQKVSFDMNVGCLIGENSIVDGNFVTTESARIDGEVRGNVTAEGQLIIGSKGKVKGNVETEEVLISGIVEGNIIAKGRVELTSNAVVDGDITTRILVIDENASFNGNCKMVKDSTIKATKVEKIAVVEEEREEKIS